MGAGRRLARNLLGSLAILGTLLVVGYGLPAVDRALPAARAVPAGEPYLVGAGVTVVPPAQAQLDVTKTRPAADRGTALFLLDTIRYAITVAPFTGTLDEAASRVRGRITGNRGYQVTGAERAVRTAQGVPGRQGCYAAPGRSGRYAAFVRDGLSVEVLVSGAGTGSNGLAEIGASMATIEFR